MAIEDAITVAAGDPFNTGLAESTWSTLNPGLAGKETPIGVWSTLFPFSVPTGDRLGLSYQGGGFLGTGAQAVTLITDTGVAGALPRTPPITQARSTLNYPFSQTHTFAGATPGAGAGTLDVFLVTDPEYPGFSGASLPSNAPTVLIGRVAQNDLDAVLTQIPRPPVILNWNQPEGQLGAFTAVQSSQDWDGIFHVILQPVGFTYDVGVTTYMTITEMPYVTGIVGPWRAHSRIDRCGKCGSLMPRERMFPDGFSKRLMVCKSCWDEPDFRQESPIGAGRERPGVNEDG